MAAGASGSQLPTQSDARIAELEAHLAASEAQLQASTAYVAAMQQQHAGVSFAAATAGVGRPRELTAGPADPDLASPAHQRRRQTEPELDP